MPLSSSKSTPAFDSAPFESKFKLKFKNKQLLLEALTHKSYAIEKGESLNNERLEFLGDSIISAVVAQFLFKKFPNVNEGRLSKLKSQIVSRTNLSEWALELKFGDFILLSQGEEATGGRKRESLLGNMYEALIGALYLDQGFEKAKDFIMRQLSKKKRIIESDFKSRLQEIIQKKYKTPPNYFVTKEEGPDHAKLFTLEVRVNKKTLGLGVGRSKKEAEQMAAKEALKKIKSGEV